METADPRNSVPPGRVAPFSAFVAAVIAVATLLSAAPLLAFADQVSRLPAAFWTMAVLAVACDARPFVPPGRRQSSAVFPSTCFTFAILLGWGLGPAVAVQAVAVVVSGARMGYAPWRTAFNAGQYACALGAAYAVTRLGPGDLFDGGRLRGADVAVVGAAMLAWFAVNYGLVSSAVWLRFGERWMPGLRQGLGFELLSTGSLLLLAPVLVTAARASAALIPLVLVPLFAVYRMARLSVEQQQLASLDPLTGLPNRKALLAEVGEQLHLHAERAARGEPYARLALLLIDLDRFKHVNDALGHAVGDRLLVEVSARLTEVVGRDMVARLGGDEFAIVMTGLTDAGEARELADRVVAALAEPVPLDGLPLDVGGSIGVALFPDHGEDFATLMRHADVAMYDAKHRNDTVAVYAAESDHNSAERLGLLADLRRVLESGTSATDTPTGDRAMPGPSTAEGATAGPSAAEGATAGPSTAEGAAGGTPAGDAEGAEGAAGGARLDAGRAGAEVGDPDAGPAEAESVGAGANGRNGDVTQPVLAPGGPALAAVPATARGGDGAALPARDDGSRTGRWRLRGRRQRADLAHTDELIQQIVTAADPIRRRAAHAAEAAAHPTGASTQPTGAASTAADRTEPARRDDRARGGRNGSRGRGGGDRPDGTPHRRDHSAADRRSGEPAADAGEITMYYQPQIAIATGEVVGVEALLRWRHPRRGMVDPEELIRVAEQSAVMRLLTFRVVDDVVEQVAKWSAAGLGLRASLNVSVRDLHTGEIADRIADRLTRYGVPPQRLQLEITEGALMADPRRVLATISRLHRLGVGIALDDFGTGYSSLQHLRRLPLSEVKVDRSFVLGMAQDADDAAIVTSMIELAGALGLRVVAEGVEDERTWRMLYAAGCDAAQGWFYARPMPAEELVAWLARYRPVRPAAGPDTAIPRRHPR
ncbi:bifunctional diguanylate cyclase/phosphodiesterase [Micromonospora thermarum]|uniref:Bifunctional diguanylate cyclase/phosphodiesterase n=1 Tax=Micromonospora thermarum TaxID=2720024 RepID=A0ABX0ZBF4_9ACTN|nr:bifunctional diguanylate cyclase/phosphodiesterase [Micromonospora thermarum]NJP33799.1 bifunctional diguanylate cyclase/phosphodiesterase [Micromonospora thermarum]